MLLPQIALVSCRTMAVCHLFCLLVLLYGTGGQLRAEAKAFIIGGQNAVEGDWPWMVHINITHNKTFGWRCGGTILNEQWILTAGQCFDTRLHVHDRETIVFVGAYALQKQAKAYKDIYTYVLHDSYHPLSHGYEFDVAMVKLRIDLNLIKLNISPITLPGIHDTFDESSECWILGWGQVGNGVLLPNPEILQQLKVSLVPHDRCKKIYPQLTSSMLCAGAKGQDFCKGDYGGPLVCRTPSGFVQAGIMSFGDPAGCGKGKPSVYTKVTSSLDWIRRRMRS